MARPDDESTNYGGVQFPTLPPGDMGPGDQSPAPPVGPVYDPYDVPEQGQPWYTPPQAPYDWYTQEGWNQDPSMPGYQEPPQVPWYPAEEGEQRQQRAAPIAIPDWYQTRQFGETQQYGGGVPAESLRPFQGYGEGPLARRALSVAQPGYSPQAAPLPPGMFGAGVATLPPSMALTTAQRFGQGAQGVLSQVGQNLAQVPQVQAAMGAPTLQGAAAAGQYGPGTLAAWALKNAQVPWQQMVEPYIANTWANTTGRVSDEEKALRDERANLQRQYNELWRTAPDVNDMGQTKAALLARIMALDKQTNAMFQQRMFGRTDIAPEYAGSFGTMVNGKLIQPDFTKAGLPPRSTEQDIATYRQEAPWWFQLPVAAVTDPLNLVGAGLSKGGKFVKLWQTENSLKPASGVFNAAAAIAKETAAGAREATFAGRALEWWRFTNRTLQHKAVNEATDMLHLVTVDAGDAWPERIYKFIVNPDTVASETGGISKSLPARRSAAFLQTLFTDSQGNFTPGKIAKAIADAKGDRYTAIANLAELMPDAAAKLYPAHAVTWLGKKKDQANAIFSSAFMGTNPGFFMRNIEGNAGVLLGDGVLFGQGAANNTKWLGRYGVMPTGGKAGLNPTEIGKGVGAITQDLRVATPWTQLGKGMTPTNFAATVSSNAEQIMGEAATVTAMRRAMNDLWSGRAMVNIEKELRAQFPTLAEEQVEWIVQGWRNSLNREEALAVLDRWKPAGPSAPAAPVPVAPGPAAPPAAVVPPGPPVPPTNGRTYTTLPVVPPPPVPGMPTAAVRPPAPVKPAPIKVGRAPGAPTTVLNLDDLTQAERDQLGLLGRDVSQTFAPAAARPAPPTVPTNPTMDQLVDPVFEKAMQDAIGHEGAAIVHDLVRTYGVDAVPVLQGVMQETIESNGILQGLRDLADALKGGTSSEDELIALFAKQNEAVAAWIANHRQIVNAAWEAVPGMKPEAKAAMFEAVQESHMRQLNMQKAAMHGFNDDLAQYGFTPEAIANRNRNVDEMFGTWDKNYRMHSQAAKEKWANWETQATDIDNMWNLYRQQQLPKLVQEENDIRAALRRGNPAGAQAVAAPAPVAPTGPTAPVPAPSAAPATRTVLVNGKDVVLTGEMRTEYEAAEAAYKARRAKLEEQLRALRDIPYGGEQKELYNSLLKKDAMKWSAERRRITGTLTGKEQVAADKAAARAARQAPEAPVAPTIPELRTLAKDAGIETATGAGVPTPHLENFANKYMGTNVKDVAELTPEQRTQLADLLRQRAAGEELTAVVKPGVAPVEKPVAAPQAARAVSAEEMDLLTGPAGKSGLTKKQEAYAAERVKEIAPDLPPVSPTVMGAETAADRATKYPAVEIKIPGDGTLQVRSQEQASALHWRLTGEPLPGVTVPPDVMKPGYGWGLGEPTASRLDFLHPASPLTPASTARSMLDEYGERAYDVVAEHLAQLKQGIATGTYPKSTERLVKRVENVLRAIQEETKPNIIARTLKDNPSATTNEMLQLTERGIVQSTKELAGLDAGSTHALSLRDWIKGLEDARDWLNRDMGLPKAGKAPSPGSLGITAQPVGPYAAYNNAAAQAKALLAWLQKKAVRADIPSPAAADLARLRGFVDETLVPRMTSTKAVVGRLGVDTRNFALGDYSNRRVFSEWASWVFPYHFWYTFTAKNWAVRLMQNPQYLSNYARYKEILNRANLDLYRQESGDPTVTEVPPGMENIIHVPFAGSDLHLNLERNLVQLYPMYDNFEPSVIKNAPGGREWMGLQNLGPSVFTPIQWGYAAWLWNKGYKDAARAVGGGHIAAPTQAIEAATALVGKQAPGLGIPPGGVNLEAPIGWAGRATGLAPWAESDYWSEKATPYFLRALMLAGKITPEQYQDTAHTKQGPLWDRAVQMTATAKGPGQLSSYLLGQGFKIGQPGDVEIQKMWDDWFALQDQYGKISQPQWDRLSMQFDQEHPYFKPMAMAREFDPVERDGDYVKLILSRLPPGYDRRAATDAAGITDLIDKFYASQGHSDDPRVNWQGNWTTSERELLMRGIDQLAKQFNVPSRSDALTYKQAMVNHSGMQGTALAMVQGQIYGITMTGMRALENEYFKDDDKARKAAFLKDNPALAMYWDAQTSLKNMGYYREGVQGMGPAQPLAATEAKFYDTAQERWARQNIAPNIWELETDYLKNVTKGKARQEYQINRPEEYALLKKLWAWRDAGEPIPTGPEKPAGAGAASVKAGAAGVPTKPVASGRPKTQAEQDAMAKQLFGPNILDIVKEIEELKLPRGKVREDWNAANPEKARLYKAYNDWIYENAPAATGTGKPGVGGKAGAIESFTTQEDQDAEAMRVWGPSILAWEKERSSQTKGVYRDKWDAANPEKAKAVKEYQAWIYGDTLATGSGEINPATGLTRAEQDVEAVKRFGPNVLVWAKEYNGIPPGDGRVKWREANPAKWAVLKPYYAWIYGDEATTTTAPRGGGSYGGGGGGGGYRSGTGTTPVGDLPAGPAPQPAPTISAEDYATAYTEASQDQSFLPYVTLVYGPNIDRAARAWLALPAENRNAWQAANGKLWLRLRAYLLWLQGQAQKRSNLGSALTSIPRNTPSAPAVPVPTGALQPML